MSRDEHRICRARLALLRAIVHDRNARFIIINRIAFHRLARRRIHHLDALEVRNDLPVLAFLRLDVELLFGDVQLREFLARGISVRRRHLLANRVDFSGVLPALARNLRRELVDPTRCFIELRNNLFLAQTIQPSVQRGGFLIEGRIFNLRFRHKIVLADEIINRPPIAVLGTLCDKCARAHRQQHCFIELGKVLGREELLVRVNKPSPRIGALARLGVDQFACAAVKSRQRIENGGLQLFNIFFRQTFQMELLTRPLRGIQKSLAKTL